MQCNLHADSEMADLTLGLRLSLSLNLKSRGSATVVQAGNYMFKVKNRNTRTRCELCSKLTIKALERRQAFWCLYC